MITVFVNEKTIKVSKKATLLTILTEINSPKDGIAVAVNNTVILKKDWDSLVLTNQDKILIIQATQGG